MVDPATQLSLVEHIRLRWGMYVGSPGPCAQVHCLSVALSCLLPQRPTMIAIAADADEIKLEADVALPVERSPSGQFAPFEDVGHPRHRGNFDPIILNALCERLTIEIDRGNQRETLVYRCGRRESSQATDGVAQRPCTRLSFSLDSSILEQPSISPAIIRSYVRTLSFLHPNTRFSLTTATDHETFHAPRGIVDMFDAVTSPYQLLHQPIHVVASEGSLQLEAIFASCSGEKDVLWCFVNNVLAMGGGTHEQGFRVGLNRIYRNQHGAELRRSTRSGVIGVMTLRYAPVHWRSPWKSIVANPELRRMVCQTMVSHATKWLALHPEIARGVQANAFPMPDF